MNEKARLLEGLTTARRTMRHVVAKVDVGREIYPGWTMKEILAHITGWDVVTIDAIRAYLNGQPPVMLTQRTLDEYNADSVAARARMTYEQVVEEWEQVRETFKTVVQETPEGQFADEFLHPWRHHGTVAQIVDIMIDHEIEHAEEIEELIEKD